MNWEAFSAITEAIGLIVIIASLIYISVQTKQANDHATASSEISFIQSVNAIVDGWAADQRTAAVIREGFKSFNALDKADQALFTSRVGAVINLHLLSQNLRTRKLLSPAFADEVQKLALAVLTTDGGLEYWEHDSKVTPGGAELLALAREKKGQEPSISDLIPWWRAD